MKWLSWSFNDFDPGEWLPVTLGLCLMMNTTSAVHAGSPTLGCFATSDLDRVFEDGYGSPEPRQSALNLFGLRNETISAQCVLLAHEDLEGLTLSVGSLQQAQGPGVIPEQNVHWNFVAGIFIEKNSPNRQKEDLLRPAPAWFPDFLSEDRNCAMRKGTRKAVYLTIEIPREAPPGEYLHWGFNAWTDDPINTPGEHRGDGWQVYPKAGRPAKFRALGTDAQWAAGL
jgi:hypothetical protein